MFDNEYYKKAESIILDYTGSSNWCEVAKLDWTSGEVQELIVIALKEHDKSHSLQKQN